MRIAITNDMPLAVEALRRVVAQSSQHSVAWTARDGAEAVANCARDVPDLILMDLFMPVMNGIEATRRIMKESPCAVLVVTASVSRSTAAVFDALGAGALDAISMPVIGTGDIAQKAAPLLKKIAMLQLLVAGSRTQQQTFRAVSQSTQTADSKQDLIAIGASAGGPGAVAEILAALPSDFRPALLLVQHVDARFTDGLVEWLAAQSRIPVRRAANGDRPQGGTLLVAGGDEHLVFTADRTLKYTPEPRELNYRPSIDTFFTSVCAFWGAGAIGVLLTGMGWDGAAGLHTLREGGAMTIAQDEQSSVVYGMPKAAAAAGAAREIIPLSRIAPRLVELTRNHG